MRIPVEKIGDLIGPKGKNINKIVEATGADIDIEDDGLVSITSSDAAAMAKAKEWIYNLTREIKVGERFEGRVTRLMDFGAFVELTPGVEGMVHISQFRDDRVAKISDVVKIGDTISVIVVAIDDMGRINLSHKAALPGYRPERTAPTTIRHGNNRRQRSGGFKGPTTPEYDTLSHHDRDPQQVILPSNQSPSTPKPFLFLLAPPTVLSISPPNLKIFNTPPFSGLSSALLSCSSSTLLSGVLPSLDSLFS